MIICLLLAAQPPVNTGEMDLIPRMEETLQGAMRATETYGPWPETRWEVKLHPDALSFETAVKSSAHRFAAWEGAVLHLRPWEQLKRRDLGALLRHELVHRRLLKVGLRRWEEEAHCLHAETHARPPKPWPPAPREGLQDRLDRALESGTTAEQAWAYRSIRAWLEGRSLPEPPRKERPKEEVWRKEALGAVERITVRWPPERLQGDLSVNGQTLSISSGEIFHFEGSVRFSAGFPLRELEGQVRIRGTSQGWQLTWTTTPEGWVAAALAGELGAEAPLEAQRALASVLKLWLRGHPKGNHPDGSLCPLTHCAVIRGSGLKTIAAPDLNLDPRQALFCGSKGGVSLSMRQVWGEGSDQVPPTVPRVPEDRWANWERTLDAAQVRLLKRELHSGLKPGQIGVRLGPSGPFAVETVRLAAGRAFGWTTWPSNACEVEDLPEDGLRVRGHGWGHNVGLCLATAIFRAKMGWKAEAILEEAFGPGAVK